jgi:hypothetical protein
MFPNRFSLICSLISGSIVAISIYMLEKFIKKAEIRELFDRAEHEGERNCKVVASFINDGIINLLNKKIKRDSDNYFTLLRCFEYVKMYMSFSVWDRVKVLDSLLLGSKQRARKEELKSEYEKYEEILDLARSFVLGLNILTPENPKEITTKLDANALRKHVESLQELRPKLFEKTMNSEDDLGM